MEVDIEFTQRGAVIVIARESENMFVELAEFKTVGVKRGIRVYKGYVVTSPRKNVPKKTLDGETVRVRGG